MLEIGQSSGKTKSFWSRPEGKFGAVFGIGLLGALGVGLYKLLPYLIIMAQNLITLTLMGAALAAMLWLILDKRFHALVWAFYQISMRKVTGMLIELDPIAIIKGYIKHLETRREEMGEQIASLRGNIGQMDRYINDNSDKMMEALEKARSADKQGQRGQVIINGNEAARLKNSIEKLQPIKAKMEQLASILNKMFEATGFMITDMSNEIRLKEQEYNAINAGYSSLRSAMSIINGDPDKKALYTQAMEHMQDTMGDKVGQMEHFLEMSTTFISAIDVQNGVFEERGLAMLDNFDDAALDKLLGYGSTVQTPIFSPNEPVKLALSTSNSTAQKKYFN
jgi:predicted  nucleic acid-binding Zn-ribbon protein